MSSSVSNPTLSRPSSNITTREVDDLLRLPNFQFTSQRILSRRFTRTASALGAITKTKRLGKQAVVIKRLILLFECTVEVRERYPTVGLEESFWNLALQGIKRREASVAAHLDAASLRHVVQSYTSAYHRARGGDKLLSGAAEAMMLQDAQKEDAEKGAEDPRARLMRSVEMWYSLGKDWPCRMSATDKGGNANPTADDATEAMASTYPKQLVGESDQDYISRLQRAIAEMVDLQRVSDEKSMKREHALNCFIDEKVKRKESLTHERDQLKGVLKKQEETIASMSEHMDEIEAELKRKDKRIEDMELGGSEDEPWIRWSTYAAHHGL